MRKNLILMGFLGLFALGSSAWGAQACPGNGGCIYDPACPKGSKR